MKSFYQSICKTPIPDHIRKVIEYNESRPGDEFAKRRVLRKRLSFHGWELSMNASGFPCKLKDLNEYFLFGEDAVRKYDEGSIDELILIDFSVRKYEVRKFKAEDILNDYDGFLAFRPINAVEYQTIKDIEHAKQIYNRNNQR